MMNCVIASSEKHKKKRLWRLKERERERERMTGLREYWSYALVIDSDS